jgi:2-dehydro-3-deoxyglucarate aldolase/4-hydroxy-2-oxoheptanedioate aldolase
LYNSTRSEKGPYKLNITFHLLKDLAKGKVIFGTMFREFSFLNKMIDRGRDPINEVRESGYRFLIIDCEHKAFNAETLAEFAERAHEVGISIWIRPEQTSEPPIGMYADIGFSGFMVPNVNYPEEAQFVANRAYFLPIAQPVKERDRGRRGFSLGDIPRDGKKFRNIKESERYANKNTLVTVQTEHPLGIKNLANILSIRGIYGTVIGTNDLARGIAEQSGNEHLIELDFSTMYRHNLMIEAYKSVGKICHNKRKYAGIHFTEVDEVDLIKKLVNDFGYQLIIVGRDENFNDSQFIEILKQARTSQT